jgi:diguanylate cyclase (GGDEF)-like protein
MEQDIKDYYDNLMETRNDLETAKEHAEVYKREANIDPLTGLSNKRAYEIAITDLECEGCPFAILMIDLNDLKVINDRYGHDKGDITLKNLAGLIDKVFDGCPVYRFGGDEFVVILRDESLVSCARLVKRFRDNVEKISANEGLQPWEKPSAACGYAVYDANKDDSVNSVFKRADEDMYEHKVAMKKARK